jgi:hypothetical protein
LQGFSALLFGLSPIQRCDFLSPMLHQFCRNPIFGLAKVQANSEARESHFMLLGMWESVREWTSTLPNELPLWELESQKTPESSESDCRGQNPLDWRFPYINENLLELICLKWSFMTHLDTSNTSYGQKKGWESPRFPYVQVVCHILLESSWRGLQFCFRPHFNQRSSHKVMGFQSCKNPNFENFGTPTWESPDKMTFGCWPRGQAWRII